MLICASPVAADTNVSANTVTVTANSATIFTKTVTINSGTTYVLNGKEIVNGTIARSINLSRSDVYYRPTLDDTPFLKGLIMNTENMAVVDTDEYSTGLLPSDNTSGSVNPVYPETNTREYNILGRDIILRSEDYTGSTYSVTKIPEDAVTNSDAIMALYKALGRQEYTIKLTKVSVGDDVPIQNSPFASLTPLVGAYVSGSGYYTNVFITRTNPEAYWCDALKDGIVCDDYATIGGEDITTAAFLNDVANMLQLNGEPVLTPKEMSMLLVAYGKNLPTYLPSNELSSVEYLMARGIISDDMNFNSGTLTRHDMLTILMRAKDKNSRLTFKDITIPYMQNLVSAGYYPTATLMQKSPIQDPTWSVNLSAVNYYDYYVAVTPQTTFHDSKGNIVTGVFIASMANTNTPVEYPDSKYLGVVDGYYHFQVPISIKDNSQATISENGVQYISINTATPSDTPVNIKLAIGGGVYSTVQTDSTLGLYCSRTPFDNTFSPTLVDIERKESSQSSMTAPIPLDNVPQTATLTFTSSNISDLLWDGMPITQAYGYKSLGNNQYSMSITSSNPYQNLMSEMTIKDDTSSTTTMPAYVNDGKNALVSVDYLKQNGLIDDMVKLSDTQYMLYSNYSNILIDTQKRLIVAGQYVIQIPSSDTSPLVVQEPNTNSYLVDYRAVMGIASDYLIFKDSNGNISISLPSNGSLHYPWSSIYPLLGNPGNQSIRAINVSGKFTVNLEDSYPLSNYLLYRIDSTAAVSDFLIVFKPITASNKPTNSLISLLKSMFGITLGSDETACVYSLDQHNVYLSKDINKAPSDVTYDSNYGYVYNVPDIKDFSYYSYLNSASSTFPLPYVYSGSTLIDCNVDLITDPDITGYPEILLNPSLYSVLNFSNYYTSFVFSKDKGYSIVNTTTDVGTDISVTACPAGVQGKYYPFSPVSWGDVADTSGAVFFGTARVSAVLSSGGSVQDCYLNFNGVDISGTNSLIVQSNNMDSPFTEVFKGTSNAIYVYDVSGSDRQATLNTSKANNSASEMNFTGGPKNLFDWATFAYNQILSDADDIMTIIIYFLLTIVPRIMMFDLIAVTGASFVSSNRLVVLFCENFVDVYAIMSFGILSVDRIDKRSIFLSTFFAMVLLTLLANGQILDIIAWVVRGLEGIIGR
jgi:hypothetical protein